MKKLVTLGLEQDLVETIDALCKAQQVSRSVLIGRWCRDALDQEKNFVALLRMPGIAEQFGKIFADPAFLRNVASAMHEEVSDEQLKLFADSFGTVSKIAQQVPPGEAKKEKTKAKKRRT